MRQIVEWISMGSGMSDVFLAHCVKFAAAQRFDWT